MYIYVCIYIYIYVYLSQLLIVTYMCIEAESLLAARVSQRVYIHIYLCVYI